MSLPCRSLTSLMQSVGMRGASFLSLDVQGAEEQVLRSVDPSVFKLICVEMDNWRPAEAAKNRRVEERILASGMVLANTTLNDIYLSKVFVSKDSPWAQRRHGRRR